MRRLLSDDNQVNLLFERTCSDMQYLFGYSEDNARSMIEEYYGLFTNKSYCDSLGVSTQDDDYFFHEAPMGMAMRIHYFLGLKGDPNPNAFLRWRKELVNQLREAQRGGSR